MKFIVTQGQVSHFTENEKIEFEDFFSIKECRAVYSEVIKELSTSLSLGSSYLPNCPFSESYRLGKDFYFKNSFINKWIQKRILKETVLKLFNRKSIHFLYDQLWYLSGDNSRTIWKNKWNTLGQISSFQDVLGSVFICLEDSVDSSVESSSTSSILTSGLDLDSDFKEENFWSTKIGNCCFIKSSCKMPIFKLLERKSGCFLQLVYGGSRSCYVHNEQDPHTHDLKNEGYVFGDKVRPDRFPLIF